MLKEKQVLTSTGKDRREDESKDMRQGTGVNLSRPDTPSATKVTVSGGMQAWRKRDEEKSVVKKTSLESL